MPICWQYDSLSQDPWSTVQIDISSCDGADYYISDHADNMNSLLQLDGAANYQSPRFCVFHDIPGDHFYGQSLTVSDCEAFGYSVITSSADYHAATESIQSVGSTDLVDALEALFQFDAQVFAIVNGTMLLAFVVGHGTGRLVRHLNR